MTDDERAVSCLSDNTLKMWNLVEGSELATLQGEGHDYCPNVVAVTPDGRRGRRPPRAMGSSRCEAWSAQPSCARCVVTPAA